MARLALRIPILLLMTLALMALAAPLAGAAVKSTVTIASGEGTEFTGRVTSPKKGCRSGRTVKLFREDDSGDQASLAGTATTTRAGVWTMDGTFVAGFYYARVLPRAIHQHGMAIRCAGDFSVRQHF
jgi:hypothetical protein